MCKAEADVPARECPTVKELHGQQTRTPTAKQRNSTEPTEAATDSLPHGKLLRLMPGGPVLSPGMSHSSMVLMEVEEVPLLTASDSCTDIVAHRRGGVLVSENSLFIFQSKASTSTLCWKHVKVTLLCFLLDIPERQNTDVSLQKQMPLGPSSVPAAGKRMPPTSPPSQQTHTSVRNDNSTANSGVAHRNKFAPHAEKQLESLLYQGTKRTCTNTKHLEAVVTSISRGRKKKMQTPDQMGRQSIERQALPIKCRIVIYTPWDRFILSSSKHGCLEQSLLKYVTKRHQHFGGTKHINKRPPLRQLPQGKHKALEPPKRKYLCLTFAAGPRVKGAVWCVPAGSRGSTTPPGAPGASMGAFLSALSAPAVKQHT
ncbi:hypothetical protein EK904_004632, partial [Melospiza melodia maxima]